MIKFLIWFLIDILSTFSLAYFYYNVSNSNKRLNWKIISYFILGVVSVTFIEYYEVESLSRFYFFVYFPSLFYMLNEQNFRKLLYYVFIVWFYGVVVDVLLILLASVVIYLFKLDFNVFAQNSIELSMIVSTLVAFFLILFGKLKLFFNKINELYNKIANINYFDVLLIVFAIFILGVGTTMFINMKNINISLLSMLVIVLMIITFVVLLKYKINSDEVHRYLKTLKENNEFYIKMEDENRIFKHNLMAKLLSIKSVSNKKAMVLIEDLISQFNKSVNFSKSIQIIPYGLNGIIYQKLYPYLKDLNIKIYNDIDYDIFNYLKPRRYNVFVEKLIIMLDNAIESCLDSKKKVLVIQIYDDDKYICVDIENTFANQINLDMLGNKNYSTKGSKHGLGLFSALRNTEASLEVKIVNDVFISKIKAKKRLID